MEQFFISMVRLDPTEQILIFVLMEQFVSMVLLVSIEQILIFSPIVLLDATNSNNKL